MCEPSMLKKTGKTVQEHQTLTINNFIELRQLAADLPIIPVLQGWVQARRPWAITPRFRPQNARLKNVSRDRQIIRLNGLVIQHA